MKNKKEKTYTIEVLLTQYKDTLSKFIYYITGRGYTHASIAVDEAEDAYYSFNKDGFRIEHPKRHKDIIKKSISYKLEVTKEEHSKIVELINEFQEKRFSWRYSLRGVFLCKMGIAHKFEWRYFCSQFVAELLQKAKVLNLKENASLYFPDKLEDELCASFHVKEVVVNPV